MENNFDGIILTINGYHLELQQSVLNWLLLCVIFAVLFVWVGRQFEKADVRKAPHGILLVVELIVDLCKSILGDSLKEQTRRYLPFLGTLILLMGVSNLLGLLGLQPPTSNVSVNIALAVMMFLLIQYNAVRKAGLKARIKELAEPLWVMMPLNIIGEFALPISLSMRLFGNILAGSIIMMLVYTVFKLFLPFTVAMYVITPFLHMYFDIFSGLLQTYIFFTLASFFLSEQVCESEE